MRNLLIFLGLLPNNHAILEMTKTVNERSTSAIDRLENAVESLGPMQDVTTLLGGKHGSQEHS